MVCSFLSPHARALVLCDRVAPFDAKGSVESLCDVALLIQAALVSAPALLDLGSCVCGE